ncbi:hypothetical protein [Methylobacterium sp. J-070]|uniref:hypothetical protein n=1 Tax=Methylobacterium sp. J-070 TaxID=2836650 RepID=UPI001FBBD99A|nr:hypothetical protein [Methylobacterium sp. J-070]MCJ2051658.1 hypothetical protein [Methylobacterium sp. J-070]
MGKLRLVPPDGADWTIDAASASDGVELAIAFTIEGAPITARFVMDRPDARKLSDGLRAAAGDGTMRTFPKPAETRDA